MLDGLKNLMKRDKDKPKNENNGKSKISVIAVILLFGIAIGNVIIQYICGDDEYKAQTIAYIQNNFHINRIDLTIIVIMLIILIIIKIKKNKEK